MSDDDNTPNEPFQVDGRYIQDADRNGDRIPDRMQQGYDSATGDPLHSDYPSTVRLNLSHVENAPDDRPHRETLAIFGSTFDNAKGMSRDQDARNAADQAIAGSSAVEKETASKPKPGPNFHEREAARKLWERRKDMPKKEAGLLKNLRHIQSGSNDGKTGIEVLQSLGHGVGAGLMIGWRQAERKAEINLYKENEEFHLELARGKDAEAAKEANNAAKDVLEASGGGTPPTGGEPDPSTPGPDAPVTGGKGPQDPGQGPVSPVQGNDGPDAGPSGPAGTAEAATAMNTEGRDPAARVSDDVAPGDARDVAASTDVASARLEEKAPDTTPLDIAAERPREPVMSVREQDREGVQVAPAIDPVQSPSFEPQVREPRAREADPAQSRSPTVNANDGGVKPIQDGHAKAEQARKATPAATPANGRAVDPSTANGNLAAGMAISTVAPMAAPVLTAGATHQSQKEAGADHGAPSRTSPTGSRGPAAQPQRNANVSVTYGKAGTAGERRLAPAPAAGPRREVPQGPEHGDHRRGGIHQLAASLERIDKPTLSKGPTALGTRRPGVGIGMVVAARIIAQRTGPDQSVLENMRDKKSVTR